PPDSGEHTKSTTEQTAGTAPDSPHRCTRRKPHFLPRRACGRIPATIVFFRCPVHRRRTAVDGDRFLPAARLPPSAAARFRVRRNQLRCSQPATAAGYLPPLVRRRVRRLWSLERLQ